MNHHTRRYDTIKGQNREEVQKKVNSYNEEEETNWVGLICAIAITAGVGFVVYKYVIK